MSGRAIPPADTEPKPEFSLRLAGGAIVWYYQPFLDNLKPNFQLAFVSLRATAKYDRFGIYIHPRIRDTKLTSNFAGTAWIEEAYAFAELGSEATPLTVKAGKIHNQLGLFWDNSFYGNIQMFDGMKLAPEHGLTVDGTVGAKSRGGFRYVAQFFPVDGRTNFSSPGRDTISIPNARRRYQSILRLEPFVKFTETTVLKGGLSAEYLQADIPDPVGARNVFRGAADLTLKIDSFGLWGEFLYQNGQTVTDFPYAGVAATDTAPAVPGRASAHNYYVLAGTEFTYKRVTARYNFSYGRYADQSVSEWIHEPGLGVLLVKNVSILAEFVHWQRGAPEGRTLIDRSLAISLAGSFSHLLVGEE